MSAVQEVERQRDERDAAIFGDHFVHFRRAYEPKDRRDAYEFERDLITLIQGAWARAQEPFAKELNMFRNAHLDIGRFATSREKFP